MQKIINFIKYHNGFTIGLLLVFVLGTATLASETVRDAVIGEEIITESGIDNSQILAADLDNFNFAMTITNVSEDSENYYVDYTYQTLAIKAHAWQEVARTGTLTVSKLGLAGQDLGLYTAEELGEIIDSQLAYLKEVQEIEMERGQTFVQQTVKYTALLGLILDHKTHELPGYVPVVQPPEIVIVQPDPQPAPISDLAPAPAPEPVLTPVCSSDHLALCVTQELCEGVDLHWYNDTCNADPKELEAVSAGPALMSGPESALEPKPTAEEPVF